MNTIDKKTLDKRLAGGDCYIRTKGGEIKGLAVTKKNNPDAPNIIVVGNGPIKVGRAKLFVESGVTVPLYIKQSANAWAYYGNYRAKYFSDDIDTIHSYRQHRAAEEVAGILFLEQSVQEVKGKRCFNPEKRKAIEDAAINLTIDHYRPKYHIKDVQKDNLGYDLYLTKRNGLSEGEEELLIEVKGTEGNEPIFWLTRNERRKSVDPAWRLVIITNVLNDQPNEPKIYTQEHMETAFNLEPYEWRATLKKLDS